MSLKKHCAIVLKNYVPKKNALALLDRMSGKITGISHSLDHIAHGCMIEYVVDSKKQSPLYMQQIELVQMPLLMAQEDILFLHHVLELCYYFIPNGSQATSVFNLMLMMYTPELWMKNVILKKIYLCKLFALLGVYPDEEVLKKPSYVRLATKPFAAMLDQEFLPDDENEIDDWLRMCILSHPIAGRFKTNYFKDMRKEV